MTTTTPRRAGSAKSQPRPEQAAPAREDRAVEAPPDAQARWRSLCARAMRFPAKGGEVDSAAAAEIRAMANRCEVSGALVGWKAPADGQASAARAKRAPRANANSHVAAGVIDEIRRTPLLTPAQERALFRCLDDAKRRFVAERARLQEMVVEGVPSDAKIAALEAVLAEIDQFRNLAIRANLRLVVAAVKSLTNARESFDELFSEGLLALLQAIENFDVERGFRLSTYATRAIRRNVLRVIYKLRRDRERDNVALGASPDVQENDRALRGGLPWERLEAVLGRMLPRLDAREQRVIRSRFGLDATPEGATLQEIAGSLGVCKERVRQLEARALKKLRGLLEQEERDHMEAFLPGAAAN